MTIIATIGAGSAFFLIETIPGGKTKAGDLIQTLPTDAGKILIREILIQHRKPPLPN